MLKYINNQRGAIIVLFAVLLIPLLAMAGLALDIWYATYTKQAMQNAVDLAALAGAQELIKGNTGNAVQKSKDFGVLNGLIREEIKSTAPYQGSQDKINVQTTRVHEYFLMPVVGINSTVLTVSATAEVATVNGVSHIFDYCFFTNTGMKGSIDKSIFNGKVHSNNNFESSGGENIFKSTLEVVGKLALKDNTVYEGAVINPASVVPMLEFNVDEYRNKATVIYDTLPNTNPLDIDGIVFVNDNLDLSGLKVRGKGSIVTVGDIKSSSGFSGVTSDDYAALISLQGNITITGGGTTFAGSLCAPKGEIVLTGGGDTYMGSIIGNYIRISNGNYKFMYDSRVKDVVGGVSTKIIRLIE